MSVLKASEVERFLETPTLAEGIRLLEKIVGRDGVESWLDRPQSALEGKTPRSLIHNGYEQIVVNLIADMLTGSLI